MNPLVDEFIQKVLGKVKYKKAHPMLAKELYDHIECMKEECVYSGMEEEKAYEKAVSQMGNPEEIGEELCHQHKPRMEWLIFGVTVSLILFGIYIIYQIGTYGSVWNLVLYFSAGAVAFCVCYFMNYQKLKKFSIIILIAGILILLWTRLSGYQINGAQRWFSIGRADITAVAVAIPLILIGFGGIIAELPKMQSTSKFLVISMILLGIGLVLDNYRIEGIILILSIFIVTLWYWKRFEKTNRYQKLKMAALIGTGVFSVILCIIYIRCFLNYGIVLVEPDSYQYINGQRIVTTYHIMKQASWFGNHGFHGIEEDSIKQIFYYGIDDRTLVYIIGQFGKIAVCVIVIVLFIVVVHSIRISSQNRDSYGSTLMMGLSLFFLFQSIAAFFFGTMGFNGTENVGFLFLSYDGTSIIFQMACLGLFLGIHRRKDILPSELIACNN